MRRRIPRRRTWWRRRGAAGEATAGAAAVAGAAAPAGGGMGRPAAACGGLVGRRPDTILSSRYLPRKEIRNKRSLLRAESGRKVNSMLNKQKSSLFSDVKRGLLYANYTKSNFIFTLTDINGNCISRISSGSIGFDKFTRGSAFAAQQAATQVSVTAGQQGIKLIDIIFKGKGFQNYRVGSIMKGLRQNNIRARRIKKDLRIPHGGCRLRKHRRV